MMHEEVIEYSIEEAKIPRTFKSTEQTQYSYVNIVCVQACMNKEKPSDENLVPKPEKYYILYCVCTNIK